MIIGNKYRPTSLVFFKIIIGLCLILCQNRNSNVAGTTAAAVVKTAVGGLRLFEGAVNFLMKKISSSVIVDIHHAMVGMNIKLTKEAIDTWSNLNVLIMESRDAYFKAITEMKDFTGPAQNTIRLILQFFDRSPCDENCERIKSTYLKRLIRMGLNATETARKNFIEASAKYNNVSGEIVRLQAEADIASRIAKEKLEEDKNNNNDAAEKGWASFLWIRWRTGRSYAAEERNKEIDLFFERLKNSIQVVNTVLAQSHEFVDKAKTFFENQQTQLQPVKGALTDLDSLTNPTGKQFEIEAQLVPFIKENLRNLSATCANYEKLHWPSAENTVRAERSTAHVVGLTEEEKFNASSLPAPTNVSLSESQLGLPTALTTTTTTTTTSTTTNGGANNADQMFGGGVGWSSVGRGGSSENTRDSADSIEALNKILRSERAKNIFSNLKKSVESRGAIVRHNTPARPNGDVNCGGGGIGDHLVKVGADTQSDTLCGPNAAKVSNDQRGTGSGVAPPAVKNGNFGESGASNTAVEKMAYFASSRCIYSALNFEQTVGENVARIRDEIFAMEYETKNWFATSATLMRVIAAFPPGNRTVAANSTVNNLLYKLENQCEKSVNDYSYRLKNADEILKNMANLTKTITQEFRMPDCQGKFIVNDNFLLLTKTMSTIFSNILKELCEISCKKISLEAMSK